MGESPDVLALLEEMLDSGKSPEEACRDFPELLSEVKLKWQNFLRIDGELQRLLPTLEVLAQPIAIQKETVALPTALGRYQIQKELGRGAFGTVYLGHDAQLNRLVAVKVVHKQEDWSQNPNEQALQEARRLAQLCHPGIVTVHDVGVHEQSVFIVSEYLSGNDLNARIRNQRLNWIETVTITAAIADALAYAHSRLIVHRDLKPANILFNEEGSPVLVDFGLALDENRAGGESVGFIAGTPWYMSPEQIAGLAHRIDGRTDTYSLGVVLYEMLTGHTPFRSPNRRELFRQIRDDEPQPIRQLIPDIPPALERICLKALSKDQKDRYATTSDFASDLRSLLPHTRFSASSQKRAPHSRHTVGRREELGELHQAFDSTHAGHGQIICVVGEPGIGKTTLVEDFLSSLADSKRPYILARGRCSERLAGTEAYLPLFDAIESLFYLPEGDLFSQVVKQFAPNFFAHVAPLAAKDSRLEQMLAESKAVSQERLKRELVAVVRGLSQTSPLLLFIDDLHWADPSTIDLFAYLSSHCDSLRVLILLTYRPTDLALAKHPWQALKLDLQARGICQEIILDFLTRSDLDRFLSLEFPDHHLPEEFTKLIYERTEGSPLFMVDLLRYLRRQNILTNEGGSWRLTQQVPDLKKNLPESVRGMIQRKIGQLKDDDRELLIVASVQGYEFDSAVIARALECDAADVEDRLEELETIHAFVQQIREQQFPDRTPTLRYRFVHVFYQNTLQATLRPTHRMMISKAIAAALQTFYQNECEEIAAELALLFESARDLLQASRHFLVAAKKASQVFANHETVLLAKRGLDLVTQLAPSPERTQTELALQIILGPALFATKDWTTADVEAVYRRANELCRESGESPELFTAIWGLFLYMVARGEIQEGLKLGHQLLGLAERTKDASLLLQAHHAIGPTCGLAGDWESAKNHLDRAIKLYNPDEHRHHAQIYGGHDPCSCCQSFAAKALWMLGYQDQAMQVGQDALEQVRKRKHPTSLAHTLFSVAILKQFCRQHTEIIQLTEELILLATDHGLLFYLAGGKVLSGWTLIELGQIEEGISQINEGFKLGGATVAHWRSYLLALKADSCLKSGNYDEGISSLSEAKANAEKTGINLYRPEIHRLEGEVLLAACQKNANAAAAESCFQEAIKISRRQQAISLELRATMSLARLWKSQGHISESKSKLTAVFNSFNEGFETPDLREAIDFLKTL